MKGSGGSAPTGFAADCYYVLAMYGGGGGMTAPELHAAIAREDDGMGWPVPSLPQVRRGLACVARRRPPLIERPARGRWRLSGHGHRMLAVWCGEDPGPGRVPCGLGWPA